MKTASQIKMKMFLAIAAVAILSNSAMANHARNVTAAKRLVTANAKLILKVAHPTVKYRYMTYDGCTEYSDGTEVRFTFQFTTGFLKKQGRRTLGFVFNRYGRLSFIRNCRGTGFPPFLTADLAITVLKRAIRDRKWAQSVAVQRAIYAANAKMLLELYLRHKAQ